MASPAMTLAANVVLALLLLGVMFLVRSFLRQMDVHMIRTAISNFQMCPSAYMPAEDSIDERTTLVLRSEVAFGFLLPPLGCVTVLAVGWTLGSEFTSYVAALSVLFIVRSKMVEAMLIRWSGDIGCSVVSLFVEDVKPVGECRLPSMKASQGSLKTMDAFSDGMVIGLAILLDDAIHARFCGSFGSGVFWWMQDVAGVVHLWGFMIIVLLTSTSVQAAVSTDVNSSYSFKKLTVRLCDSIGFSSLEARLDERDTNDKNKALAGSIFTETLLEQAPQMKLQLSLLMAQGVGVLGQPIVLLSISIACFTMCIKCMKMLSGAWSNLWCSDVIAQVLFAMGIFAFVAYVVAALVMMEYCEDHIWGITTGCVSLS